MVSMVETVARAFLSGISLAVLRHLSSTTTASKAGVAQIDREAAASGYFAWLSGNPVIPNKMKAGLVDDHSMVQAFARHRQAALIEGARAGLEAGRENWDGLARSLMMAFDMQTKTPRAIFRHLELCGMPIPQWMRDESEMKHLDHVPSKGTRAVLIYRAMTEDLDPAAIIARYLEKQG